MFDEVGVQGGLKPIEGFLAKPVAVDAPGCQSIAESGRRATARKRVFLVDFQTRANEYYRKALQMVRNGETGKIVMGDAR